MYVFRSVGWDKWKATLVLLYTVVSMKNNINDKISKWTFGFVSLMACICVFVKRVENNF